MLLLVAGAPEDAFDAPLISFVASELEDLVVAPLHVDLDRPRPSRLQNHVVVCLHDEDLVGSGVTTSLVGPSTPPYPASSARFLTLRPIAFMNAEPSVLPWLRVLLAVGLYVVVALLASALIRRFGVDHKDVSGRASPPVVVIGILANTVIAGLILVLLVFLDHRGLGGLGLRVSSRDGIAMASSLVVLSTGTALFLEVLQLKGDVRVRWLGVGATTSAGGMASMVMVLVVVALQEELLYRGYIAVNLLRFGATTVVVTSVLVFTAIHFLTNRAGVAQAVSWLLGGGTLIGAYLLSGSLWVAVLVHLTMDLTNVVAFGIVGSHRWLELQPELTSEQRTVYRFLTSVALLALFAGLYGASVKLA